MSRSCSRRSTFTRTRATTATAPPPCAAATASNRSVTPRADDVVSNRWRQTEDYQKYCRLVNSLHQLAHRLSLLPSDSAFRQKHEALLLEKLDAMGLLATAGPSGAVGQLSDVPRKVTASAFARRRLPVVMTRLKMADYVSAAIKLIEQGHVRVGTEVVTDPAFLVTRSMEDFVTWVDSSKIKRNIMQYRNQVDDFDLHVV